MFLALLCGPAWATDVLVPAPTPGSVADFSVAYMFGGLVVSALEDQGISVEDDDAIRRWAPGEADACYETTGCPESLWSRTDARLAVVMAVSSSPTGLHVQVRLVPADGTAPTVLQSDVASGGEVAYAATITAKAAELLPKLPARPTVVHPTKPATPPVARTVEDEPEVTPSAPAKPEAPHTLEQYQRDKASRREQAQLGLPWPTYVQYRESGKVYREWAKDARVRAQKLWLAAWGGVGYGDVDRGYDVREQIEGLGATFAQDAEATVDTPVVGLGAAFGGEVGYAPTWWSEIDVLAGAQLGTKHLTTGWECTSGCAEPDYVQVYADKPAMSLWIEPRFKGVFVPTGVVKPYALVGATVMASDGFSVPEGTLTYSNADSTIAFGPTAGLGLAVDPIPQLSIQLEVPYTIFAVGGETTTGDASAFASPPGDYGGGLPGVVRGTLSLGVRL